MKIDLVRKIDYFVGIPICFLLSIIEKVNKTVLAKKNRENLPQKIVFLEFSEIGSIILAYPAMERVKVMYPNAALYFWTFADNSEIFDLFDIIPKNNLILMRSKNIFTICIDVIKNLHKIRSERIDTVIDMELFSRFSSILTYLSGAKIRVGFHKFSLEGLYRGNLHSHKVSYNPYMHISKNFLSLSYSLKAGLDEIPLLKASLANAETIIPKIKLRGKAVENIWEKLKGINNQISEKNKIIILNPGISESLPLRKWPIENYIELAKRLLADQGVFIVIIGVKPNFCEEKTISQEISNPRFINLIGKTTMRELINLFNISNLLISHDSGAIHLASLIDINMIILFGPETPPLYAPLSSNKTVLYSNLACSPCITAYNHRRSICRDNKCLKMIAVEEVYNTAKNV